MARFAADTTVPAEKSRAEIERTLMRYGASSFAYTYSGNRAVVMFEMNERRIAFELEMPSPADYRLTPTGKVRSDAQRTNEWEKGTRQRWRALLLVVKAKLEAVESGITDFENEFMAHTIVPGPHGEPLLFGKLARPEIARAYETGKPPMLALEAGT